MILYHEMFKQVQFQLGAARITSFTYQSFQQTNRVPTELDVRNLLKLNIILKEQQSQPRRLLLPFVQQK